MAGTVHACAHVMQGAPVAGTFQLPGGVMQRDHTQLAQTQTVRVCAVCLAQGTGGGAQVGKSIGDSGRYFGSKLG